MRKIKVNINRPQANPEQVAGLQQFDQMLSMYKKAKYLFYAKVVAIITAVIAIAAVAGYLFLVKSEHGGDNNAINKLSPNDPYASTMVESQYFELDASKDTVVEGTNGTVIAIPAGAFLDEDGNVFKGKVKLEIVEASSPEELIAGNIATDTRYGIHKALFTKATASGKELKYNPEKPVLAEVTDLSPDSKKQVLDGERNNRGEMSWTSRGPVKKYLVTIPLAELDFLPDGFEKEVQKICLIEEEN